MLPAIPPQMERIATLVSCVSKSTEGSVQTVPVTASGLTEVFAGSRARTRFGGLRISVEAVLVPSGRSGEKSQKRGEASDCVAKRKTKRIEIVLVNDCMFACMCFFQE